MDVNCLLSWQLLVRECFIWSFLITTTLFFLFALSSKCFKKNKAIKTLSYWLVWILLSILALWASIEFSFLVFAGMNYVWGIVAMLAALVSIFSFFSIMASIIEAKNDVIWTVVFGVSIFAFFVFYSNSTKTLERNCSQAQVFISEPPFL